MHLEGFFCFFFTHSSQEGNSQALVIDKQTLAQMGLAEAGEVSMTLHGRQLVITPVSRTIQDLAVIRW